MPMDITGHKYGKITVISKTSEEYSDGSFLYECKCDCGNIAKTTSTRQKVGT